MARPKDNVCLGKEWYRFPSSFHLPYGVRAKFIRSEFSGLLPGEFSEANVGFGLFPGTWLVPSGMNDENLEDPGKYVSSIILWGYTALTIARSRSNTVTFLLTHVFPGRHRLHSSLSTFRIQSIGSS